jgi:Na+/proline symporter
MFQIAVVVLYLIAVTAIGIISRKKSLKIEDYLVAGRKGSTLFITGSLLAQQ